MIAFFLVALLLSLISGVLATFIFLPSPRNDLQGLLLRLFVGGGLGLGLSACLYFLSLPAGLSGYIPLIDLAACMALGLIAYVFRERGRREVECPAESQLQDRKAALPKTGSKLETWIATIFAVELLASLGSFLVAFLKEPHGKWDAWLIWNMHARFLYRSGEAWREVFAGGMEWSHWDYPLLLPLSIVRGWKYSGNDSIYIPAAFALLFTLLTLGLLLCALMFLRRRIQGYLAAMILLGTPLFIMMGASQLADVPLAFFMLATLVLLFLPARSPGNRSGALVLSGIAAGLCAWTKNEGLLFLLIVYLLLAGARIDDRDRTGLVRTAAVLLLTPAGYFFVYVLTPLDLGYHLATSLNRLFLRLWPSVIFLFFMVAGAPERAASAGERPGPGAGPGSSMPEKRRRRRVR